MIKAIETIYAGYRFRSRLEARWAVFFDALKLEWRYEEEGYETSAGWYLPDFRVYPPGWFRRSGSPKLFFEVKGADLRQDEAEKIAAFVSDDPESRHYLMPLGNIPDPRRACGCMFSFSGWAGDFCEYHNRWESGTANVVPYAGFLMPAILDYPFLGEIEARRMNHAFRDDKWSHPLPVGDTCLTGSMQGTRELRSAITAARSARFEHEERE